MDENDEYAEQRALLNEVRGVGPGSRGGKGAWKRRHPKKIFTRRLSQSEQIRADATTKILIEDIRRRYPETRATELAKLSEDLLGEFGLAPAEKRTPYGFWRAVLESARLSYIPKGNALHRKAVELAYALLLKVVSSENCATEVAAIEEMSAERAKLNAAKKPRKIVDIGTLLRAIIRLQFKFEIREGGDDRYEINRLARAVEMFMAIGITPDKIAEWQKEHGGGLDVWQRKAPRKSTRTRKVLASHAKILAQRHTASAKAQVTDQRTDMIRDCNDLCVRAAEVRGLEVFDMLLLGIIARPNGAPWPNDCTFEVFLHAHIEDTNIAGTDQLKKDAERLETLATRFFKGPKPKPPYNYDGFIPPD